MSEQDRSHPVWVATYASAFAALVERDYLTSWEMGKASRLYGMSRSEVAASEYETYAEVASGIADAALRGYWKEVNDE